MFFIEKKTKMFLQSWCAVVKANFNANFDVYSDSSNAQTLENTA